MTGSFMDYAMPRAIDFPRFELEATVTPTPVNPLGAKGCGEAGTLGSTPSIVSAAVDALSEFGVKHIDMMLRPEKLWWFFLGFGGLACSCRSSSFCVRHRLLMRLPSLALAAPSCSRAVIA